ncbi:TPA: glycosyltransferase [Bacillus cereus]
MIKKSKILFVLPSLQGGGAEKVVLNVIEKLDKNKYEPILFLFVKDGAYLDKVPKGTSIRYALEKGNRFTRKPLKVLKKMIKESKEVDLIVSSLELTTTYISIIAGVIANKPTIGWVHIDLDEFKVAKKLSHRILLKSLYPLLSGVIAVSNGVKESVEKIVPSLKGKTEVVYNPLPVQEIQNMGSEKIPFGSETPMVLAAGRLTYQKSFDFLVRCHARLIKQGVIHNLVILGEGEEKTNLQNLIKQLDVEDTVFLMGFQKNPYSWIEKADIFVLSSRFEGFGMVIAEAMALGVPIVSTDCPSGPAELLDNGKYGMLVESQNEEKMCEAIKEMLNNEEIRKVFKNKGLERITHFDENSIVPQLESLFTKFI